MKCAQRTSFIHWPIHDDRFTYVSPGGLTEATSNIMCKCFLFSTINFISLQVRCEIMDFIFKMCENYGVQCMKLKFIMLIVNRY